MPLHLAATYRVSKCEKISPKGGPIYVKLGANFSCDRADCRYLGPQRSCRHSNSDRMGFVRGFFDPVRRGYGYGSKTAGVALGRMLRA